MGRALRITAAIWIVIQLAAVCAAPVVLACAHVPTAADDEAACCPGLLPGQVCPMHHTREGAQKCHMRSACGSSDASLVTLTFGVGVLPSNATLVAIAPIATAAAAPAAGAIARPDRPEPPPPRL